MNEDHMECACALSHLEMQPFGAFILAVSYRGGQDVRSCRRLNGQFTILENEDAGSPLRGSIALLEMLHYIDQYDYNPGNTLQQHEFFVFFTFLLK